MDVAPDGEVVYRQRLIGTFNQPLDLRRFPFDSEVFTTNLVLLGSTPRDVELTPDTLSISGGLKGAIGRSQKTTMQDWRVTSLDARTSPYSLVPGTAISGYDISFAASRLPQHYLLKVILPLVLIVFMSWTVFWIDPTLGSSQISVAVTSMLTLIGLHPFARLQQPPCNDGHFRFAKNCRHVGRKFNPRSLDLLKECRSFRGWFAFPGSRGNDLNPEPGKFPLCF